MQQVDPPKPVAVLALFTVLVLTGSVFIILPVVLGILSVVTAAIEIMLSSSNVAGDFSNIVIGNILWKLTGFPYRHWLVSAIAVIAGTAGFVIITRMINRDKK